jgi:hypothetical protein
MSSTGMPSVMQTISGISASIASQIASAAPGGGARFRHGVEHRQAEMRGAAFARRGAAHHLGAVGDRGFRMKGAVLAGEALADDLGVGVDEDGHPETPTGLRLDQEIWRRRLSRR